MADQTEPGSTSRPSSRSASDRAVAPLLYIWGDDDLLAERLVGPLRHGPGDRSLARRSSAGTSALTRRPPRASPPSSGNASRPRSCSAAGRWPSSPTPGPWSAATSTRDAVIAAMSILAPGNAVAFVESTAISTPKGRDPSAWPTRCSAAGGRIVGALAPRPTALGAWIETEARDRGLALAPGAARALADRLGSRVTDGDVDRRYLSRIAVDGAGQAHAAPCRSTAGR